MNKETMKDLIGNLEIAEQSLQTALKRGEGCKGRLPAIVYDIHEDLTKALYKIWYVQYEIEKFDKYWKRIIERAQSIINVLREI